jgi:hypothetical protein
VTEEFKSPGVYGKLDYSNFGIPIEVDADPKERGQCARGIHVVPINEDADLHNVVFTDTMILLEVAEEDIVYCEGNGKMRVRKAIPIRQIVKTDKEWEIIKTVACKASEFAYFYALYVDQKPTDETRTADCKSSGCAYMYAREIDKKPTDETRTAACYDPYYAYLYAIDVDQNPTNETRTGACQDSEYAYKYAKNVDNCSTKETRIAAHQNLVYAYLYDKEIHKYSLFNYMKKMLNKLFMKTKSL